MLGSSHAGERAAAAMKAIEFIKGRGHTWESFLLQAGNINFSVMCSSEDDGLVDDPIPRAAREVRT